MLTHSLSARNSYRGRPFVWRIDWAIVALLITPYLIATIWFIFSTKFWSAAAQPFAEVVITHRSLITLGTAIMAATSAFFFFWPVDAGRLAGWWSRFVGLAYTTFMVQYSLRFIAPQLESVFDPAVANLIRYGFTAVIYICSALNNLLFLAAARILLNKNKSAGKPPPFQPGRPGHGFKHRAVRGFRLFKYKVVIAFKEFRGALPAWAWVAACLAAWALLESNPRFLWARFPDAIFSAYCLSWFGYAMAINFNVRRRNVGRRNVRTRAFVAALALLMALAYGAGQVVFATHPIIAHTASANNSPTFPLPWIREKLGNRVNNLTTNINKKLKPPSPGAAQNDKGSEIKPVEVLDAAVFALLLPMKGALFIPAFFLYLMFISSVNDFRYALGEAITTRQDYLSSDGIVKGIGKSIEADKLTLYIRIPGVQKRLGTDDEERVLPLAWDDADSTVSAKQEDPFPIDNDPLLIRVMKTEGEEITVPEREGDSNGGRQAGEASFPWLVPVRFHGGVIGVLRASLKSYRKNHTTLQKLRLMADIVAPSVQDFRSLAAADQIGFRFTRLQVDNPQDSFEAATKKLVDVLHDVLAPLATRMTVEIGFQPVDYSCPQDGDDRELVEKRKSSDVGNEKVQDNDIPMLIWTGKGAEDGYLPVGTLWLTIQAEKDEFARPTLAAYHLTRKMAASFATDGLFDVARDSLGAIIKDLGVEFSKETLTLEEWFGAITRAATKAGLLWAVMTNGVSEEVQDAQDPVRVIHKFSAEEEEALLKSPMNSLGQESPTVPAVCLRLGRSKHRIWFGIAQPDFGPELDFESPWKVFLYELRNVTDTALYSLQQRQSTEAEKVKAAQYQGVMTIAVTTGTLMHQLFNMIKDQLSATEVLEEEMGDGRVQLNPRASNLLMTMRKSAEKMQLLTHTFKNVTKMEDHRPCSLKDAAEQAMKLFEVSLVQRRIKVETNIPADAEADVPFYVAAFALANLIGNAKDAVRAHGLIEIQAEDNDTFLLCHVTNNGPNIPASIQDGLFQFGKSTKHGHNGWGLYFVEKALKEGGGGIWLAYSNSEATRFTIRLPKPKRT